MPEGQLTLSHFKITINQFHIDTYLSLKGLEHFKDCFNGNSMPGQEILRRILVSSIINVRQIYNKVLISGNLEVGIYTF